MPEEITAPPGGTPPPATPDAPTAAAPAVPTPPPPAAPDTRTPEGDATVSKVPEAYDLKPPEGYAFNEGALAKFQERARARGLTQEQAQEDMDYLVGELQGLEQTRASAWQKQQETWLSDIKADKELGGKNFDQTVSRSRAFTKVLDPTGKFREVLDAVGLANHPVLVRGFARLGALMEDDTVDTGGAPSTADSASSKEMFPNSKMN